jgi:hypothetical protein
MSKTESAIYRDEDDNLRALLRDAAPGLNKQVSGKRRDLWRRLDNLQCTIHYAHRLQRPPDKKM